MSVSASTRRALQRVDDKSGILALLLIDSESLSAPIRLVNDTRDLEALGETWTALPFEVKLPSDVAKNGGRAQLRIDNVGRELTADLESLPPSTSLMATLMIVHRSTPEVVDYQLLAPLSSVRVDMKSVTATIGYDDILRTPAVKLRFDPFTAPGLFAD